MSEKIDTLPEGWALSTLGEVCEPSQYGYTTKAGPAGNYKFLRTTDITKEELNWENVPHCELLDEDALKYVLKDGDIVISRAGSIGYSCLIRNPPKAVFASYLIRFRPLLNNQYLNYFLATPDYWQAIIDGSSGIAVQNVNAKTLSAIEVPIAPENEQTRIVEKLEELLSDLDNGVAELKAAQIKLTQYRQSLLKSAVEGTLTEEWRKQNQSKITETGEQLLARILKERREQWEQTKLAEFKEKGKKPPKDWQKKYPEPVQPEISGLPKLPEGWVWASLEMLLHRIEAGKSFKCLERHPMLDEYGVVKVSAVTWGEYDELESKTCTRRDMENDDYLIKKGDFLFSRANTTELVGACVIAYTVTKKVMLSDKILRLVFVEDALKYWVLQYLRSQDARDQIELSATGNQASMKNISQAKLKGFTIPIPNRLEISKIKDDLLSKFEKISQASADAEQSRRMLYSQRKNILKDAFSGKLVAQDPSDEPARGLLEKINRERSEKEKRSKSKKPKKKVSAMNKLDLETVKAWVTQQSEPFTFEQLQSEYKGDYDILKDIVFELLQEETPLIKQAFNEERQSIVFEKAKK